MLTAVITVSAAGAINTTPIAYGQISTTETVEAGKLAISENSNEAFIRQYFEDQFPEMIDIARCESEFRQYDKDGQVLKNPNSTAIGLFQIMASLHEDKAAMLGFDIRTAEGNAAFAFYMREKYGTRPWDASKNCWGKTLAYNG